MRRRLLTSLLLLTASLACGIPLRAATQTPPFDFASRSTPEGQDTLASAATSPALSSPTIQLPSPNPAPTGSTRYFVDEFNSDATGWTTFVTSGEAGLWDLRVENGFWVFNLGGKNINAFTLYQESYINVRMDFRVVNRGEDAYKVSLLCRYNEKDGWYQFDIFNTGLYNIYYFAWDKDKKPSSLLLAEGRSDAMRATAEGNDFTMICKDQDLSLFINGTEARSINESRFFLREGQVGVGISSFTHLPVILGFDWLMISVP